MQQCLAALILALLYLRTIKTEEFHGKGLWRFDWPLMRRLLRFGLPAGTESLLNVFAFNIFVQLMHSYGPEVAAAVTIAFNWDIVAFIPITGLSVAITAVAGQHLGAGETDEASQTAYTGLKIGYSYSIIMMLLFIFLTAPLVRIFSSGFSTDQDPTFLLARMLLRLAALYTLADSTQLVFAGALRAAGDTKWIMRTSIIIHWCMAALSFVMIRLFRPSPVLIWCFFISMIILMSILMYGRFRTGKWKEIELIEHD